MRVPDDLSVGGFDDVPEAARAQPALTTVRQPMKRLGAEAVRMVLALLAGEDLPATHIESPMRLVARGRTSPPAPTTVREVGT